ncbi:MAG: peptide-methionine (S)-S-oxide reductase MsrA [Sphingomonas sp.]
MIRGVALGLAGLGAVGFASLSGLVPPVIAGGGDKAVAIPPSSIDVAPAPGDQVAVLAGGCFWGMEAVFEQVKGVKSVVSGYAGGTRETATYAQVVTERTRHAEAIRIVYDPRVVSYATLLRIYFSVAHDPTQLNRQGPDTGPSYRSAIFPQNPGQARVARAYIDQLGKSGAYRAPIVTKIESGVFFEAEAEHQDFARRNPSHGYIVRWDKPKVAAFRAAFPSLAR